MTSAEAWFNIALCPRKPGGSLGRTAQDSHLNSHTAPELCGGNTELNLAFGLMPHHDLPHSEWSMLTL